MLQQVNEAAAMPAFNRLEHGVLEQLLEQAGFVDVRTEDITDHMLPGLRVFSLMGRPAYAVARLLRQPARAVNAMSGVEFYRHQEPWRYRIYSCRKP